MKPTIEAFQIGPKRHGHFRSPLTGVDLTIVRTRNCATWLAQPRMWQRRLAPCGRIQPNSRCWLERFRALIARVKAADPSIKRVDELLAAGVRRSRMSGRDELCGARLCARAMGKNISRQAEAGDRLGRSA